MNLTKIAVVTALAVGAVGIGLALKARADHRNLVTLHVRNVPLAEVVRQVAKQAHEEIGMDAKLSGNVTLDVKNASLTNVLDLLADQAGARWGRTYAVYDSKAALPRLESVFTGNSTLEAEGWTNLAPQFARTELPAIGALAGGPGPQRILLKAPDGSMSGKSFTFKTEDDVETITGDKPNGGRIVIAEGGPPGNGDGRVVVRNAGPGAGGDLVKLHVMLRVSKGPDGTTTTTTTMDGDGERVSVTKLNPRGEVVQEDHWSRERLVIETPLVELLGGLFPEQATAKTAAETASKIHGHFTTYYAMEKPPLGGEFRPSDGPVDGSGIGGTNNPMAVLRAQQQEKAMGGLGKLSPEEQVQRARQLQESKGPGK